jgi:hypothetical protein
MRLNLKHSFHRFLCEVTEQFREGIRSVYAIWYFVSLYFCNLVFHFSFFFLHPDFVCLLIIISGDIDGILVLKTNLAR